MTLSDEEAIRHIVRQELERFFGESGRNPGDDPREPDLEDLKKAYDTNVII